MPAPSLKSCPALPPDLTFSDFLTLAAAFCRAGNRDLATMFMYGAYYSPEDPPSHRRLRTTLRRLAARINTGSPLLLFLPTPACPGRPGLLIDVAGVYRNPTPELYRHLALILLTAGRPAFAQRLLDQMPADIAAAPVPIDWDAVLAAAP